MCIRDRQALDLYNRSDISWAATTPNPNADRSFEYILSGGTTTAPGNPFHSYSVATEKAKPGTQKRPMPGDIVVFNTCWDHVAIAVGNATGSPKVISLWVKPNGINSMQQTTIEKVSAAYSTAPRIEFFTPKWKQ